jgi:hypothetical protein
MEIAKRVSVANIELALTEAKGAHHEYELTHPNKEHDWPAFYTAYLLGKFGNFALPHQLARLLNAVPVTGRHLNTWYNRAAQQVYDQYFRVDHRTISHAAFEEADDDESLKKCG